ncbi:hypothetical protein BC477_12385 [Clavibacter michiganensis subsp. michiganensis]|uniref:Uncharacterized protein n=1 Tax=Clavibacter michiganensis subsp. michiganensis TaxID=33013 RepID=A0A251XHN3_CLAMM|nr:hypothetical protein BC477_12385 [Clavibacter michiganensis subsp. michiganensis]OUE02595.1 hypothetical protein CMMCAS07_11295 [Clavibacter michiganensis subsp. michiganensis]
MGPDLALGTRLTGAASAGVAMPRLTAREPTSTMGMVARSALERRFVERPVAVSEDRLGSRGEVGSVMGMLVYSGRRARFPDAGVPR